MPGDGNPMTTFYARLTNVAFQTNGGVKNSAVERYIRESLRNMKLLTILSKLHEAEGRALLRLDDSEGFLDPAHVERIISDRFKFLERTREKSMSRHRGDDANLARQTGQDPSGQGHG